MVTQIEALSIEPIAQTLMGENTQAFFKRVWATPPAVYENRLKAVGFEGLNHVVDCGCGFGQWTIPLAGLNRRVSAVDISLERIQAARGVADILGVLDIEWHTQDLNQWQCEAQSVDGIFSYSALYYTDFIAFFEKAYQWLQPGGLFYFNTNDLGYSLNNLFYGQNQAQDYSPRAQAVETIANSLRYYSMGVFEPGKCIVMPQEKVLLELKRQGFEVIAFGPDGSICLRNAEAAQPFFPAEFEGICSVYEVLCRKPN